MKNFSLKALGAFIFAAGLVVVGVAAPASAIGGPAPMNVASTVTDFTTGLSTGNFTVTATQVQSSANMRMISVNIKNSTPIGWEFKSGCPSAFNTNLSLCGVTGIRVAIDGTNFTDVSAGAQVKSFTYAPNAMYTITLQLASDVAGVTGTKYQIDFADSFTVGSIGTYALGVSVMPLAGTPDSGTLTVNSVATVSSPAPSSPSVPSVALTLGASNGSLVAGSSVAVIASGLQPTAAYTVTVQSTPQTIGSGNAVSGSVNTNVTLPSGLEAGWHTLTFTSTASDGSAVESKYYFKVSASGTLLSTSSTIPAELANTGINTATGITLLAGGLSLALVGAEMFMIARRKRSN